MWDEVWDKLAAEGVCDERDGAEYRRVLHEWESYDVALLAESFIRFRANQGPPAPTSSDRSI